MRSDGCIAVLLLDCLFDRRVVSPGSRGLLALAAGVPNFTNSILRVIHIPWLGPGLIMALLLLMTLRGSRRMAHKPLHRKIHPPRLERYQGVLPKRHRDLEI